MATNIFAGRPNAVIAKATISIDSLGFDATNINVVYEVGNSLKSWIPGRPFNPLTIITTGRSYWIVPKIDMDLTAYFYPPNPDLEYPSLYTGWALTSTSPPVNDSFQRWVVNDAGTYTNFHDINGTAIIVSSGEVAGGVVELWGINGVWEKVIYSVPLVDYIKKIDAISKSSVVDNLVSNDAQKVLSANQGSVLKGLIDNAVIISGSSYRGVATPTGTPPVVAGNFFLLANQPGTYANYGGVTVTGNFAIISKVGAVWSVTNANVGSVYVSINDAFGAMGNGFADDTQAMVNAFDFILHAGGGTLFGRKGVYMISSDVRFNGSGAFQEGMLSIIGEKGMVFKKTNDFPEDGYIFQFRKTKNITISGVHFEGISPDVNVANFGDGCITFTSSENITVENCGFKNFGDGVLKVSSTGINNTPIAVESKRVFVKNNFFENCFQTSTTTGGVQDYIMADNIFLNSRIKFATRYNVADRIIISNNTVSGIAGITSPIEIVGYSNVIVEGNTIKDSDSVAINIYSNSLSVDDLITKNISIINNTIFNTTGGIRVDNSTLTSGFKNLFKNLKIKGNTISETHTNPCINITNGSYQGIDISGNYMQNTDSLGVIISISSDSTINDSDLISITANTILAPASYSIRVQSLITENRKLKNVFINGNNMLDGAMYLSNIADLDIFSNVVKFSSPSIPNQTDNLSLMSIKMNRFMMGSSNGFNLVSCSGIDFCLNNIEGTSPAYNLRYDATCSGVINEINNNVSGAMLRNVPVYLITSGIGSPNGTVIASIGSIYSQRDGPLWYKASGDTINTGWSNFVNTGGAALGAATIGSTNGNLTLLANAVNFIVDQVGVSVSSNLIKNRTDFNNANADFSNNGLRIARGISSSAASVMEIRQQGIGATGDILAFRDVAGTNKSGVNYLGYFRMFKVLQNIDFGSVPANSRLAAPATIAITGSVVGDKVIVYNQSINGLMFEAFVTSADTVTAYAINYTTSAIDPTAVDFQFTILK